MLLNRDSSKTSLKNSFSLIKKEIQAVELELTRVTDAFDKGVSPYVSYICETEGKRIRPALTFLAGGATGTLDERHVKLGTILELIHIASLVHDDIIDGADERRKVATAHAKWGEGLAVLLGDALFSEAMRLSTEFGDLHVSKKISIAARDVCQGEILQTQRRFDLTLTKEDYFKVIEMKTGALFGAATGLAAYLSGFSEEESEVLEKFGLDLGVAYQIYDDCLDMVGTEEQFGKTLGTDLEKGKLTLPLLYLLEESTELKQDKIRKRILNQEPLDLPVLVGIADYEGAIDRALDYATEMIDDRITSLDFLDNNKYKESLINVSLYIKSLFKKLKDR